MKIQDLGESDERSGQRVEFTKELRPLIVNEVIPKQSSDEDPFIVNDLVYHSLVQKGVSLRIVAVKLK